MILSSDNYWLFVGAILMSTTLPLLAWAKSPSIDERLMRLETIIENEKNLDLLNHLDSMQQEVRELRGKMEEQQNELQLLSKKQEKLYLSLDNRMNSLPVVKGEDKFIEAEKSSYNSAYKLVGMKKYTEAIAEFKNLLLRYPNSTYSANAYYWLGEIYLAQWNENRGKTELVNQAIDSFNAVISGYPDHHKAADALLKLGLVAVDQENWLVAKDILSQVIEKYPGSSRSTIASLKIQRMQEDGLVTNN